MLCSTNLDISRLHRVFATPFFKLEYKKYFLKLPITQQSLFGEDFDKLSEKVIKEQSSINKVLKNTSSFQTRLYQSSRTFQQKQTNYNAARGRGKGRGRYHRSRERRPFSGSNIAPVCSNSGASFLPIMNSSTRQLAGNI